MILPPVELMIVLATVAVGALAVFITLMVIGCQYCRGIWRADPE
jgi:hypothetical protein